MTKPLLSIGMIFKNERRCLERCLESLRPLREAVPCELVMADTGSDDGSREIAARYADILFDFPWIDDFAAARNAVMDRCSGEWYLSIDADEWLDPSFEPLVQFLRSPAQWKQNKYAAVLVRNYTTEDMTSRYSDFLAVRMALMSTGARYTGAIHEQWSMGGEIYGLNRVIFHHDGYLEIGGDKGRAKRERNMSLLKKKLEEAPEDLVTLLQCIESSRDEEQSAYIRRALEEVGKKPDGWQRIGPPIYRYAVNHAKTLNLPELEEYAARAREWFPDSPFITVDVAFFMLCHYSERKEYEKAVLCGETYLSALDEYRRGGQGLASLIYGTLAMTAPAQEHAARVLLADSYFRVREFRKSADALMALDGADLSGECMRNAVGALMNLHAQSGMDMREAMEKLWKRAILPEPAPERAEERRAGLSSVAARSFERGFRDGETGLGYRHAYTLFEPLEGQCAEGDAAIILETDGPAELTGKLASVKDLKRLPAPALAHALGRGAALPPLSMEDMDVLAVRLAPSGDTLYRLARAPVPDGDLRALCWARALAMSAVRSFPWKDPETGGMELARNFAAVEKRFINLCYAPEMLTEENLFVLPPLHRFGWYCARAFDALEAGDSPKYVRLLREGLESAPEMKGMVEFLLERLEEERREAAVASAPPELLELAEQVRAILGKYPPDDPAVAELKESEIYQKVAWLIEDPAAPALSFGVKQ